jgi:hypothetical protein
MLTIPAVWCPVDGELPILDKKAGDPFLLMRENGHEIILIRSKPRVIFKLIEVSSTIGADSIKPAILKVMRELYETWAGLLPDQGHRSFYGVLHGKLYERDGMHWVHIGIGYTSYVIDSIQFGDPVRVQEMCEANQLPQELVIQ